MSNHYAAVGWNRQKKIYDRVLLTGGAGYLVVFSTLTALFNPDYTFETLLIRATATLAILLLHIILSIGPLARVNRQFLPLLYNRRHLGVTMFLVAAIHGSFSIIQFHSLGNEPALVSLLTSNTRFGSLPGFPFQLLGFLALVIFFLMAVTSHDFWLHQLSPKTWKTLHMFVYLAYALIVMHVMLGVIQYEKNPFLVVMIALGAGWLVTIHLLAGIRERRIDRQRFALGEQGFVDVCHIEEMKDGRAKIFCVGSERIAVYRHDQKLFAIHNVCKHQGGPLGEGRIVDGCITCPWHGYQYLPHNGQSPPPFTERVSTYDLRIVNGRVWLNPRPYPEGTERPGAEINQ